MSGLEIFGLIASLGGITGAIIETYGAIRNLHGLPEAFNEVNSRLPLVQSTLDSIKSQVDRLTPPDEEAAVASLLGNCIKKAEELLRIFEKISRKSEGRFAASVYTSIVTKLGKKHRVETLMRDILKDLNVLMANRAFQTVPQAQSDELAGARDSLAQTCLDQPDSGGDGDPGRGGASQTGPRSRQYNNFGGSQRFVNGHSFEANRDQYFGRVPARNVNSPSDSDSD